MLTERFTTVRVATSRRNQWYSHHPRPRTQAVQVERNVLFPHSLGTRLSTRLSIPDSKTARQNLEWETWVWSKYNAPTLNDTTYFRNGLLLTISECIQIWHITENSTCTVYLCWVQLAWLAASCQTEPLPTPIFLTWPLSPEMPSCTKGK